MQYRLGRQKFAVVRCAVSLRVNERDHDVASAADDPQTFVVVSESARVQQTPALLRVRHAAVVAEKAAAASL